MTLVVWPKGKKAFDGGDETTFKRGFGEIIENSTTGSSDYISLGHLKTGVLIFKALS